MSDETAVLRRQLGMWRAIASMGPSGRMVRAAPGISRGYLQYWRHELTNPRHRTTWGGQRYTKYSPPMQHLLEGIVNYIVVSSQWTTSPGEIVSQLERAGVTRWWIHHLFKSWGWTWVRGTIHQIAKFTIPNLVHYAWYISFTLTVPWINIKYADEASYSSRELQRRWTIGPRGLRRRIIHPFQAITDLNSTFSLTALTSINPSSPPISIHANTETNTQLTWLQCIIEWLEGGQLVSGDVLVADNARIHSSQATQPLINALLDAHGVRLVYLPKYSPETNPCEPVWSISKSWLRYHRGTAPFLLEIIKSFAIITRAQVFNCYINSLTKFTN